MAAVGSHVDHSVGDARVTPWIILLCIPTPGPQARPDAVSRPRGNRTNNVPFRRNVITLARAAIESAYIQLFEKCQWVTDFLLACIGSWRGSDICEFLPVAQSETPTGLRGAPRSPGPPHNSMPRTSISPPVNHPVREAASRAPQSGTGSQGVEPRSATATASRAPAPTGRALIEAIVVPMGPHGWEARAEGVLWQGGRLRLVGTAGQVRAEARRLGIEAESMDGRLVLPGFVDAHTHFLHVGIKTTRPDLRGAASLGEALRRVAEWLAAHPGAEPVIAEGWDEAGWPEARRPTRDEVDLLVATASRAGRGPADRPVVLRRICGHVAVAGSAALPLVWGRWPDPEAVDQASGLLLESPSLYLNEVMPSTPGQLDRAVQEACREAHRFGVTAVGDYSQAPYRAALQRAAAHGTLTVRVASSIYVQQLEAEIAAGFRTGRPSKGVSGPKGPQGNASEADGDGRATSGEWLRDGGLKVFLDGSLGGRTAFLREPYVGESAEGVEESSAGPAGAGPAGGGHGHAHLETPGGGRGTRIWTDADLDRHFGMAQAAGVQVHAHAIGDAAIDQGLAAFHRLATRADLEGKGWGGNAMRHRFEHFEIAHDEQVVQAAELGLVSSSQPNFVGEWSSKGGMYQERLGDRFLLNNRFRRFKDAGLPLAFGSDGMPFGPLVGLHAAVAHPDEAQRLAPLEAAWHYTWMAAWSLHWETLGHLAPGNPADLVILEGDPDEATAAWKVCETIVDGRSRFQRV